MVIQHDNSEAIRFPINHGTWHQPTDCLNTLRRKLCWDWFLGPTTVTIHVQIRCTITEGGMLFNFYTSTCDISLFFLGHNLLPPTQLFFLISDQLVACLDRFRDIDKLPTRRMYNIEFMARLKTQPTVSLSGCSTTMAQAASLCKNTLMFWYPIMCRSWPFLHETLRRRIQIYCSMVTFSRLTPPELGLHQRDSSLSSDGTWSAKMCERNDKPKQHPCPSTAVQ